MWFFSCPLFCLNLWGQEDPPGSGFVKNKPDLLLFQFGLICLTALEEKPTTGLQKTHYLGAGETGRSWAFPATSSHRWGESFISKTLPKRGPGTCSGSKTLRVSCQAKATPGQPWPVSKAKTGFVPLDICGGDVLPKDYPTEVGRAQPPQGQGISGDFQASQGHRVRL